ncbi:hypothetical protein ACOMHN_024020 [Nucella lapillus]
MSASTVICKLPQLSASFHSYLQASTVILLEFMGPERRTVAGCLVAIFWILGTFLVCGLSYFIWDWRWLQVLSVAPFIFCLSYWWLIDESPRWLLSRGRVQEARKVLLKVMKVNKIPIPTDGPLAEDTIIMDDLHQNKASAVVNEAFQDDAQTRDKDKENAAETDKDRETQREPGSTGKEKTFNTDKDGTIQEHSDHSDNTTDVEGENHPQTFLAICKYRNLIGRTAILFVNWSAISTTYYGLSLNVTNLGGDLRLNFFLSNLVELVGTCSAWYLMDRLGRKSTHCASMILSGVSCLATIFSVLYGGPDLHWLTITLVMVGKLGISTAFTIIYLLSGELYPTVIRNQGMGFSSMVARVATALSPYIADLSLHIEGSMGQVLPLAIFGALALIAGLLSLCLPETLHRKLPDTIEEAANFSKPQSEEVVQKIEGDCPVTVKTA